MIERRRRLVITLCVLVLTVGSGVYGAARDVISGAGGDTSRQQRQPAPPSNSVTGSAAAALGTLAIQQWAAHTGYTRQQFSDGWEDLGSCDMRNFILARDMTNVRFKSATDCTVMSGRLDDPYTAKIISFVRGPDSSGKVQIDHVVPLSNVWETGGQALTATQRYALANDPLELLAVDGSANLDKSDSDAASWLPTNKLYRCRYVARQIAVKQKYRLWVTSAERDAMHDVLQACPGQPLPVVIASS